MSDSRVQIDITIDSAKAEAAADRTGKKWEATGAKIDQSVRKTSENAARAATAMSSAIGAATAGVAAQEQAWLSLGTSILGSFAAGGPIGGAIAIGGALVGLMTSSANEATELDKRLEELTSSTDSLRAENERLERELLAARGVDLLEKDFQDAVTEGAALTKELDRVQAALKVMEQRVREESGFAYKDLFGLGNENERGETRRELIEAENSLRRLIDLSLERARLLEQRRNKTRSLREEEDEKARAKRIDEVNKKLSEQLVRERALQRARTDRGREALKLGFQSVDLSRAGVDPALVQQFRFQGRTRLDQKRIAELSAISEQLSTQAQLLGDLDARERALLQIEQERRRLLKRAFVGDSASDEVREQAEATRRVIDEYARLRREAVEDRFPGFFGEFLGSTGPQLSQGLAAVVTDGFQTGFDNAGDIAQQFLASLGGQLLTVGSRAALSTVFPSLFAFATGGSFIADRPQLFLAGERGPERVRVEPTTGTQAGAGGGGGGGGSSDTLRLEVDVRGNASDLSDADLARVIESGVLRAMMHGSSIRRVNRQQMRKGL